MSIAFSASFGFFFSSVNAINYINIFMLNFLCISRVNSIETWYIIFLYSTARFDLLLFWIRCEHLCLQVILTCNFSFSYYIWLVWIKILLTSLDQFKMFLLFLISKRRWHKLVMSSYKGPLARFGSIFPLPQDLVSIRTILG